jgi:hypothetical protein
LISKPCQIWTLGGGCWAWLRYQLAAGDLTPDSHAAALVSFGEAIEEMGDNGIHLAAFGVLGAA